MLKNCAQLEVLILGPDQKDGATSNLRVNVVLVHDICSL